MSAVAMGGSFPPCSPPCQSGGNVYTCCRNHGFSGGHCFRSGRGNRLADCYWCDESYWWALTAKPFFPHLPAQYNTTIICITTWNKTFPSYLKTFFQNKSCQIGSIHLAESRCMHPSQGFSPWEKTVRTTLIRNWAVRKTSPNVRKKAYWQCMYHIWACLNEW